MTLGRGLFHYTRGKEPPGPERPSTFHLEPQERTKPPTMDYPTGEPGDMQPTETMEDVGDLDFPERPIGVYLATPIPADRPITDWSGATISVGTVNATPIAGGDRHRQRFYVENLGAKRIYLLRENVHQNFSGIAVEPDTHKEFFHNGPIWVRADDSNADPVEITYFAELSVDEHGKP